MRLLVTGGAGYVGSHTVRALLQAGHDVTLFDNFSTGHRWACQDCPVIEGDLRNAGDIETALRGAQFDGVLHFAAKSLVGESASAPLLYYQNNVTGTLNLVQAMVAHGVDKLVFSSTAAVYGTPQQDAIDEDHPRAPINVYGETKRAVEDLLEAACAAHSLSATCLRYFNAAGANSDIHIGEWHEPETHLIPNALRAAAGTGPSLTLFGDDYPTHDGTCIRDYVHVDDLASAHMLALTYMENKQGFGVFNLGNGAGYSVREVLAACEQSVGRTIPHSIGPRRAGDPARLVASSSRAQEQLGWIPAKGEIQAIVDSAWAWEQFRADNLA